MDSVGYKYCRLQLDPVLLLADVSELDCAVLLLDWLNDFIDEYKTHEQHLLELSTVYCDSNENTKLAQTRIGIGMHISVRTDPCPMQLSF